MSRERINKEEEINSIRYLSKWPAESGISAEFKKNRIE